MRTLAAAILAAFLATAAAAHDPVAREGWVSHATEKTYDDLVEAVKAAAGGQQLGVVTEAGPTEAAAARGIEIPGNRVIGLFNPDFAVRILGVSTAAMIEAPVRMYVTENPDGTATLSYKTPSHVFAPYMDEGGDVLRDAAAELDAKFEAVAEAAIR